MEKFKIEHHEKEHGAGTFVPFRHLSKDEAQRQFCLLKEKLELPSDLDGVDILEAVEDRGRWVKDVDAESEDFDLQNVLTKLRFHVSDLVYLIWYPFDNVDELRAADLFKAFDDIWYPSSDDLCVFDSNMDWIILITHYGAVSALSLRASAQRVNKDNHAEVS